MIIDCIFKAKRSRQQCENILRTLEGADLLSGDSSVVKDYESFLKKYFNVQHAIAVSSGTAALHASIVQIIKPGDEVLVPAICVPMTVSAILQAGGIPVFYDCLENSFHPAISSLEKHTTSSTSVLITVSMWGYSAINEEIADYAKKHTITIIEDAAQSAGTCGKQGYEGTIGDIGCFSTHEFKLISTGEGGFVLTNSDTFAKNIREFTHIGFCEETRSFGYADGLNYKLSSFQAAIGIEQLSGLKDKIQERNDKINFWKDHLSLASELTFMNAHYDIMHNGYSLCCLLSPKTNTTGPELAKQLNAVGINTDSYRYKNTIVCNYPFMNKFYVAPRYSGKNEIDFPNATELVKRMLILPCHEEVTYDAIAIASQRIINLLM
ncbi:DegT/DnrJ/EryC1/StrS family aminotransferase [Xenorhabdus bovienii]|uniref:DegT/DnrJ/EryC1/StrS family aminotransferase n=1 Tax=Xenorhabdus bovienii TaxID=40576 RepID=UPI0023B2DA3A|nr:aminotransferase class I/II-fold pyridoxal phosphate-dependent enzyme [Xenorhabdus bovienii]MDE9480792.1 aminotransferase class I/II-fold pyridoxal phosphate-dependent enzyme [Xenorhabdus bovienii]